MDQLQLIMHAANAMADAIADAVALSHQQRAGASLLHLGVCVHWYSCIYTHTHCSCTRVIGLEALYILQSENSDIICSDEAEQAKA